MIEENKDYTKRMNEYDSLINAIESTRNLKTNFIGETNNESFYEKFRKINAPKMRRKIYQPGTYILDNEIPRSTIIVNERTNNGNGNELTWEDINALMNPLEQ